MDWTQTPSSQIKQYKHEPERKVMTVEFRSGGVYEYADVDEAAFDAFHKAESHGKHLGMHIKGKHAFKRIN